MNKKLNELKEEKKLATCRFERIYDLLLPGFDYPVYISNIEPCFIIEKNTNGNFLRVVGSLTDMDTSTAKIVFYVNGRELFRVSKICFPLANVVIEKLLTEREYPITHVVDERTNAIINFVCDEASKAQSELLPWTALLDVKDEDEALAFFHLRINNGVNVLNKLGNDMDAIMDAVCTIASSTDIGELSEAKKTIDHFDKQRKETIRANYENDK